MIHRRLHLPLLLLALACAPATSGQDFGKPLTQEQVDCEERQLMRLIHRVKVNYLGSNIFFWRSSPAGGVYRGLSATSVFFNDPDDPSAASHEEEQLAFDLLVKQQEDFLSPQRLRLPQATLVRRDEASNLSSLPDKFPVLDAVIDLAPEVPDPVTPRMPLRISNRRLPGAGHDDGAGRSLVRESLHTACHAEVTDFDLKVYSILARTVRATQCLFYRRPQCPFNVYPYKAVIFRGIEPLTYRMNFLFYGDTCFDDCIYGEGSFELLFRFQVDGNAKITGGEAQVLPWCTGPGQLGCNDLFNPEVAVLILPPMMRPGHEKQGPAELHRAGDLEIEWDGSEYNILHTTINWPDLLKDTTWNQPRP